MGDMTFVHPTTAKAALHADFGCEVYLYSFEARNAFVTYPPWVRADHMYEIPSMMGLPFICPDIKFSDADRALSITMMRYWTNFAKTGNPNGAGLPEWPRYNTESKQHLTLDTEKICQSSKLKAERMRFWATTAAKLLQD